MTILLVIGSILLAVSIIFILFGDSIVMSKFKSSTCPNCGKTIIRYSGGLFYCPSCKLGNKNSASGTLCPESSGQKFEDFNPNNVEWICDKEIHSYICDTSICNECGSKSYIIGKVMYTKLPLVFSTTKSRLAVCKNCRTVELLSDDDRDKLLYSFKPGSNNGDKKSSIEESNRVELKLMIDELYCRKYCKSTGIDEDCEGADCLCNSLVNKLSSNSNVIYKSDKRLHEESMMMRANIQTKGFSNSSTLCDLSDNMNKFY